jgi:hypothetical protein
MPPEHIAILDLARERIETPFLSLDADDVGVRGQQDRTLGAVAFESRDKVRLSRVRRLDDLDVEPERLEARGQYLGDATFVARRVARVGANEVAQQRHRRVGVRALGAHRRTSRRENRRDDHDDTRFLEHVGMDQGKCEGAGHTRMTSRRGRCNARDTP